MLGFNRLNHHFDRYKWAAIAWFLAVLWVVPPVLAQIAPPTQVASGWGVPRGNRRGGGQRDGSCPSVDIPLSALVPLQDDNGTLVAQGTTAADYPTLWFYVPYAIGASVPASLWVEEPESGSDPSADRVYYTQRQVLSLPPTPAGIVSIQLPRTEPALTAGRTYRWLLVVQCSATDLSSNKVAALELSRVSQPSTITPSGQASLDAQLDAYRQAGLWSEFITILATAYCEDSARQRLPGDGVTTEWSQMLQDIGLEAIAAQSDLTCSAR